MSINNMIPNLTAAQIIRTLEDNLVAKKICDQTAAGEVKKKGDSVTFPSLADPTIRNYAGTVDYEGLQDAGVTLYIDQAKYFAFEIGDIEAYQATIDAKSSQASRAAYALAKSADEYVLGLYKSAGNSIGNGSVTVTEQNVLSTIALFEEKMMEVNADGKNLWMVMPPFVKMFLQLAGVSFKINEGISGTGGLAWTSDLGFDLYISNLIPTTISQDKTIYHPMAGTKNAIVYADQIVDTETLRLETKFANAVRGLHVYGAKVIRPKELVTGLLVRGTPSTI